MHQRRVVITGLGVLAPNGCGKEPFWQACIQGRSGVRPITGFATDGLLTRIAGQIPDFSPATFGLTPTECSLLGRSVQLAVAAANLALEDAGLSNAHLHDAEREGMGVYMGGAMASVDEATGVWVQFTGSGTHPPRVPSEGISPTAALLRLTSLPIE